MEQPSLGKTVQSNDKDSKELINRKSPNSALY